MLELGKISWKKEQTTNRQVCNCIWFKQVIQTQKQICPCIKCFLSSEYYGAMEFCLCTWGRSQSHFADTCFCGLSFWVENLHLPIFFRLVMVFMQWYLSLGMESNYLIRFLQIKPLVEPTRLIVNMRDIRYSWHDFVSKSEFFFFFG